MSMSASLFVLAFPLACKPLTGEFGGGGQRDNRHHALYSLSSCTTDSLVLHSGRLPLRLRRPQTARGIPGEKAVGGAASSRAQTNRAMSPTPAPGAGASEEELSTEVVVVRHGETAWNASKIVQGQLDPELNEAGRQQAVVVAGRLLSEARPAAVYSSDLRRAAETAEIIAGACGVSNVVLSEALRERHMGYLQGLTWHDAMALAKSSDSFRGLDIVKITEGSDPDTRNQELPGGESMNQLNERSVSYLNKIAQQHIGERVVVVSHVATILGLCRHTNPLNNFTNRDIPNTSLNVFRISSVTGQWTLERWGDVTHLEGNYSLHPKI